MKTAILFLPLFFIGLLSCGQTPDILWQKCLGGSDSDYAYSISNTPDNGFIIAGSTNSTDGQVSGNHGGYDAWIVKLDSAGNIMWSHCYGGSKNDTAYWVEPTRDGGYIFVGSTSSNDGDVTGNHGGADAWMVKLDSAGNILWQKLFGGSADDQFKCIKQTTDGGYVVLGRTSSIDGDLAGLTTSCAADHSCGNFRWKAKFDPSGNVLWKSADRLCDIAIGSIDSCMEDYSSNVIETQNGDYAFTSAGSNRTLNGETFYSHLEVVDSLNRLVWANNPFSSWDMISPFYDPILSTPIVQTADGSFYVGARDKSIRILKYNPQGALLYAISYNNTLFPPPTGNPVTEYTNQSIVGDPSGGIVVLGADGVSSGSYIFHSEDLGVIKIDNSGDKVWEVRMGGTNSETASGIVVSPEDTGYVCLGTTGSNDGDVSGNHGAIDIWVVKLLDKVNFYVTASELVGCAGSNFTFTANNDPRATNSHFQWLVNGIKEGPDLDTFRTAPPIGLDTVTCIYTCTFRGAPDTVKSDPTIVQVTGSVTPQITITPSDTVLTPGTPIYFTAMIENGGVTPVLDWRVNGVTSQLGNLGVFHDGNLKGNDTVYCILTSSMSCATVNPTESNKIIIRKNSRATRIIIYPNPATKEITIAGNIKALTITDGTGRAVYRNEYAVVQTLTTIDIQNLERGVYFVNYVDSNNQMGTATFLVN